MVATLPESIFNNVKELQVADDLKKSRTAG
jgi:hypothetical protein